MDLDRYHQLNTQSFLWVLAAAAALGVAAWCLVRARDRDTALEREPRTVPALFALMGVVCVLLAGAADRAGEDYLATTAGAHYDLELSGPEVDCVERAIADLSACRVTRVADSGREQQVIVRLVGERLVAFQDGHELDTNGPT
jgi:hypothetical protein